MVTDSKIQPHDIDSSRRLTDTFGRYEDEVSAMYVLRYCQEKGTWVHFTQDQIDGFYSRLRGKPEVFSFNYLIRNGWIKKEEDLYIVTHEFIGRCWTNFPAKEA